MPDSRNTVTLQQISFGLIEEFIHECLEKFMSIYKISLLKKNIGNGSNSYQFIRCYPGLTLGLRLPCSSKQYLVLLPESLSE